MRHSISVAGLLESESGDLPCSVQLGLFAGRGRVGITPKSNANGKMSLKQVFQICDMGRSSVPTPLQ